MYSALSTLNTTTEVPLSKALNPQLLPGRRSINGCPLLRVCVHGVCVFTAVCVHFGWVKCRARILSMGHHTWLYVTSLSLFFLNKLVHGRQPACLTSALLTIPVCCPILEKHTVEGHDGRQRHRWDSNPGSPVYETDALTN